MLKFKSVTSIHRVNVGAPPSIASEKKTVPIIILGLLYCECCIGLLHWRRLVGSELLPRYLLYVPSAIRSQQYCQFRACSQFSLPPTLSLFFLVPMNGGGDLHRVTSNQSTIGGISQFDGHIEGRLNCVAVCVTSLMHLSEALMELI